MDYQAIYETMVSEPKYQTKQGAVSKTLFEKAIGTEISHVEFRELHIKHLKTQIATKSKSDAIKALVALEQITYREGEFLSKETDEETVAKYTAKTYPNMRGDIVSNLPECINESFADKLIFLCVGEKTLSMSTVLSTLWNTCNLEGNQDRGNTLLSVIFSLESPSLFEVLERRDSYGNTFPVLKPLIKVSPIVAGKLRSSMGVSLPSSTPSTRYEGTKNVKHELNDNVQKYIKIFNNMPFQLDEDIINSPFKIPKVDKLGNPLSAEERETIASSLIAARTIASFRHEKLYMENTVDNRFRAYNAAKYFKHLVYAITHQNHPIDTTL